MQRRVWSWQNREHQESHPVPGRGGLLPQGQEGHKHHGELSARLAAWLWLWLWFGRWGSRSQVGPGTSEACRLLSSTSQEGSWVVGDPGWAGSITCGSGVLHPHGSHVTTTVPSGLPPGYPMLSGIFSHVLDPCPPDAGSKASSPIATTLSDSRHNQVSPRVGGS